MLIPQLKQNKKPTLFTIFLLRSADLHKASTKRSFFILVAYSLSHMEIPSLVLINNPFRLTDTCWRECYQKECKSCLFVPLEAGLGNS